MKLFICHVSEDKADFVEPLARALRGGFDVWYDKFQLTLGDSLLQKITEGLLSSDFGVVVLSKAFFAKKKWAENELAALFTLETTTRKIILPVWKDVTETEVKAYSPILANRFAVSASQGLQKVVDEIKLAVSVSERKDEIARDETSSKVKALVETLTERKESERLAYSEEGAQLVSQNFDLLCTEIQRIIERGLGTANVIKFGFARPIQHVLYVNTIYGMYLGLGLRSFFTNSVTHAVLDAKIFKRQFGAFGDPESSGQTFNEIEFKPSFRRGEVIWFLNGENKRVFATDELAAHLVEIFIEYITEQADVA